MELTNRRVLITGAGQGIGRAIAIAMGRSGACLYLWGRTKCNLLETQKLVRSVGAEVEVTTVDVSVVSEVKRAWDVVAGRWGGIDVLVNNAGVQGPMGHMHEIDVEDWWRTIEINLRSTFLCSQTVLPDMIMQNRGKIINLSGGGAVTPRPFFSAYSASKAAIVRLTETLAAEVKHYGIDVNAIAPGFIYTDMTKDLPEKELKRLIPLRRFGKAEEVAYLASFLTSDKASYITGEVININGGIYS